MTPTVELLEKECEKRGWDVEMLCALAWVLERIEIKKNYYKSGHWDYALFYRNKRSFQRTDAPKFQKRRMTEK